MLRTIFKKELMSYIDALEKELDRNAEINLMPLQPGDVPETYANVDDLVTQFDFKPETTVTKGVASFVAWYLDYFQI